MNNLNTLTATAMLWAAVLLPTQAIEIDGHTAAEHDRFANDGSFVGSVYDWSGVGRATTGTAGKGGHWATMISDNVFLSSHHYHPDVGTSLHFYPTNDPATSPEIRVVAGGERIGSSDLWIGYFNTSLPDSIKSYNYADITLTAANFGSSIIADENALLTGITPTSGGYGADPLTSMAVGRNIVEYFDPALEVSGTTAPALITVDDLSGEPNHVSYEAQTEGGDSGAPMFIDNGGELLLSGINWAIGQIDIQPGPFEDLRDASVYSYVGNYDTEIQNYINAHLIPEPSACCLLLTAGLGLCFRRRR